MPSSLKRGLGSLGCMLAAPIVMSSACSATPKGSLMLSISTDMQTPKDISTVSIFVTEGSNVKFDYVGRVLPDGTVSLPSTLALVEPDDPNTPIQIRVIGFNGRTAQVLRDVQTTIPHERTALLRMPLDFLDLGSVTGQLPAKYYPTSTDGVTEGDSQFDPTDPTVITSTCDPMHRCQTPGASCQTMINGQCTSAAVVSSTLPVFTPTAVYGDGGVMTSGAPESCFPVETCFAEATPVTSVSGQGTQTCSFPLPTGASPSTLNVALVTPSVGACLASGCYVPLPNDPDEGWTVQGGTVQLAPGVCAKLGSTTALAVSSGACAAETPSEPVCEPTTPAEVAEAGAPPVLDAGLADAVTPDAGSACGGNFVITCPATSTCGGGYAALTVSGTQAMLSIEQNGDDGGETVSYEGVVDPTSCVATFVFPAPEAGSCSGPIGTATVNLATGANFTVGCSNGSGDGSCTAGTLSCTASRGTLDGGPSNNGTCPTGETSCGGACVNEQVDPNNCGACGFACTGAATCIQGICAEPVDDTGSSQDAASAYDATITTCASGFNTCNGTCVDELTDSNNCGACGFACSAGTSCTEGICASSVDAAAPPTDAAAGYDATITACASGFVMCNGTCVNEQTDPNNCSACGFACPSTQTCVSGVCTASIAQDAGSSSAGTSDAASPDSGIVRYADCEQFLGSGSTTSAAVMTGLNYPGGLVPDQGTLYMTSGGIVTGPTIGGTTESYYVPDGGVALLGVAVDQTYVYWTQNDGTIWSCEKSGCTTPAMIATNDLTSGGGAIRTDGVNVCWTYAAGVTCMTAGANPQPVFSIQGEPNPVGLSMCSGYVIWSNMVADGTVRIAEVSTTGTAATLAYGLATPDGVASDGTYVYVATMGAVGGTQQALLKMPMDVLDASAPEILFQGPGQQWSSFVAVRGSWVYWTNQYSGVVYATPTDGGTTVTVAESPYPLLISTDTTTLYWAECDDPASVFTAPLQ